MELTDTHCHIHFDRFAEDVDQVIEAAKTSGVTRLICVGTTLEDSQKAVALAQGYESIWAAAGVHPHDASKFAADSTAEDELTKMLNKSSICAVGEIGLDYFKLHSTKEEQLAAFAKQLEIGLKTDLPFIFHVRDAWEDFWRILADYPQVKGVVHSFSAGKAELEQILKRDLYVGLNGIMTFTTDEQQHEAARIVPKDRLLLETDAPFLTPKPYRGTRCEPKHIVDVAMFLAELRGETLEQLAAATTKNAMQLFKLG